MKYLIAILLALLLTGCSSETPAATHQFTDPPKTGPVSEPIVQPSQIHHSRALSAYDFGITDCLGIYPMGDDMVLISGSGETLVTVFTDNAVIRAQKTLPCPADPATGNMQICDNGIAYYDCVQNAVVLLNTDLLEIRRFPLPGSSRENILISSDWSTVYYCSADAIHALDLQTGTPRMVRGHSVASQTLTGLHLNGQLLACLVTYADGVSECLYLSTQTGESFYPGWNLNQLYTDETTYLASFRDGSVNLWLTGQPDREPWMLHISQNSQVIPVYASDALVVLKPDGTGTELSYLDITVGRRSAAITLDVTGISKLSGNNGIVWFLARDPETDSQLLYRWSPGWSRVWNPGTYYRTYYTANAPDRDELLRLAYRAKKLGDAYGINILIGEDTLASQPDGHTFETEYRVAAYERDLAVLESALANFPQDFFRNAAFGTKNRRLTINLVRNIRVNGSHGNLPGKQYWLKESAYITLIMGEKLEQSFYHQLCHIIDNRVLGTTSVYDNWAGLNPEGIAYANSYTLKGIPDQAWFSGDTRVFVDPYSMSYPREDRARILEYAMLPGNEALFASETMQRKLSTLCLGIRQAFALSDDTACLWEQYLIDQPK